MTRQGLIFGLFASPLALIAAKASLGAEKTSRKTIVFPSGVYRITPGGGIYIIGNDVYIRGCVFDRCTIKSAATSS